MRKSARRIIALLLIPVLLADKALADFRFAICDFGLNRNSPVVQSKIHNPKSEIFVLQAIIPELISVRHFDSGSGPIEAQKLVNRESRKEKRRRHFNSQSASGTSGIGGGEPPSLYVPGGQVHFEPPESVLDSAVMAVWQVYGNSENILYTFCLYVLPAAIAAAENGLSPRFDVKNWLRFIIREGLDVPPSRLIAYFEALGEGWSDGSQLLTHSTNLKQALREGTLPAKYNPVLILDNPVGLFARADAGTRTRILRGALARLWLDRSGDQTLTIHSIADWLRTDPETVSKHSEQDPVLRRALRVLGRDLVATRTLHEISQAFKSGGIKVAELAAAIDVTNPREAMTHHFEVMDAFIAYENRHQVGEENVDYWYQGLRQQRKPMGNAELQRIDRDLTAQARDLLPKMSRAIPRMPVTPTTFSAELGIAPPDLDRLPELRSMLRHFIRTPEDAIILNACDALEKNLKPVKKGTSERLLDLIDVVEKIREQVPQESARLGLGTADAIQRRSDSSPEVKARIEQLFRRDRERRLVPIRRPTAAAPAVRVNIRITPVRPAEIRALLQSMGVNDLAERRRMTQEYGALFNDPGEFDRITEWWQPFILTGRSLLPVRLETVLRWTHDPRDLLPNFKKSIRPRTSPPLTDDELDDLNRLPEVQLQGLWPQGKAASRVALARRRFGSFRDWDDMNQKLIEANNQRWNPITENEADIIISGMRARLVQHRLRHLAVRESSLDMTFMIRVWNRAWGKLFGDRYTRARDILRRIIIPGPEQLAFGAIGVYFLLPSLDTGSAIPLLVTFLIAIAFGLLHEGEGRGAPDMIAAAIFGAGSILLWTSWYPLFGLWTWPILWGVQILLNFGAGRLTKGVAWLRTQGPRVWFVFPATLGTLILLEFFVNPSLTSHFALIWLLALELSTLYASRARLPFSVKSWSKAAGSLILSVVIAITLVNLFPAYEWGRHAEVGFLFPNLPYSFGELAVRLADINTKWLVYNSGYNAELGMSLMWMWLGSLVGKPSSARFKFFGRGITLAGLILSLGVFVDLMLTVLSQFFDGQVTVNDWTEILPLLRDPSSSVCTLGHTLMAASAILPVISFWVRVRQDQTFWRLITGEADAGPSQTIVADDATKSSRPDKRKRNGPYRRILSGLAA